MASCAEMRPRTGVADALAERAFKVSRAARRTPAWVRMAALQSAAAAVEERAESLAQLIATEGVKTIREATVEVRRAAETLRLSAEECRRNAGELIRFDQVIEGGDRFGWWRRRPLGVVLAITPYNDPLNLVAHKIGPAVAAGAPVIVKPHPTTVGPARELAKCFEGTELPVDMIQIAPVDEAVARELAADPRVAVISFTGSRAAGKAIAACAGLKRFVAEMGGIGTAVVDHYVDPGRAAAALVSGFFWAAGQNCIHTQRALIRRDLFEPLVERLVARTSVLKLGPQLDAATDIGPLLDERKAAAVEKLVDEAVRAGARLLTGGRRHGRFYEPTILADVAVDHQLWTTEIFGPVAMVAPFDNAAQALRVVNEPGHSINVALFTDSLSMIAEFQNEVLAGSIIVNDSTDFRIDAMPFGGDGTAGLGREGVRNSIEAFTEAQVTVLKP